MKRTQDRDRAALRRERKHGESDEQYQERVRERLAELIDPKFTIRITRRYHPTAYIVAAYGAGEPSPAVRIERPTLSACANAFEAAAGKLAGGFAK